MSLKEFAPARDFKGEASQEQRGTLLGQEPSQYPGMSPTSRDLEKLAELATAAAARLDAVEYENGQIRATLLLNFGNTTNNKWNFYLDESDPNRSTMSYLMAALTQLSGAGNAATGNESKAKC